MILDTTYLLPLAKVGVDSDLLLAVAENRTKLRISEISVSLLSIFELQAKTARLKISSEVVEKSIESILENLAIVPFSDAKVLELSFELREHSTNYVDCVIMATAAARREDLATEDSRIWRMRRLLHDRYGIDVYRYKDLVGTPS